MNIYFGVQGIIHLPNKVLLFGFWSNNKLAGSTFSNLADKSIQDIRATVHNIV